MSYLIFIVAAFALLGGFFVLTNYEVRRGVRYFATERDRLDHVVERVVFVSQHVDIGAFLRNEIRRFFGRLSHDIAHLSLQTIRAAERVLTRLVRYLRSRHVSDTAPGGNVREFVKTLSEFKGGLKATHPEMTDVQDTAQR